MLSNISGFPEFLPHEQIAFDRVVANIRHIFEKFGFVAIDTPAVERVSTLLAKGNDHEIYGLYRLADEGGLTKKDLALRFDLTVPLARYVAQHYSHLHFPYRRYHVGAVWRGERPQSGRYRQFYQCDIDIVGEGELPLIYDAEVVFIIYKVFAALGVKNFIIKLNHRQILIGLLQSLHCPVEKMALVLRIIDKMHKISEEIFDREIINLGFTECELACLKEFLFFQGSSGEILKFLDDFCDIDLYQQGLKELKELFIGFSEWGVPQEHVEITPSLARGLAYYTGMIAEVILPDYPQLGSVCGGGRYDNLTSLVGRQKLPGVGLSIGLSRLIPVLMKEQVIKNSAETPAILLITSQNPSLRRAYISLGEQFRDAHIKTETYLMPHHLSTQMKYADKKGFIFVAIGNEKEFSDHKMILKNLQTDKQRIVGLQEALEWIREYT